MGARLQPTAAERSLCDAWTKGEVWSPDYFRAWRAHRNALAQVRPVGASGVRSYLKGPEPDPMAVALDVADQIRADFIRTLLEGGSPDGARPPLQFDETGARMDGGTITGGALNLAALHFGKPIEFTNCTIEGPVILRDAKLGRVSFDRSTLPALDGVNAVLESELSLALLKGCRFVRLSRARIGGLADLQGTKLNTGGQTEGLPGGNALDTSAAKFEGSLWLRGGFEAHGAVALIGAKIGGHLSCDGAEFHNESGIALDCDSITVGSDVFMRSGFLARGQIDFVGARIGDNFDCRGGQFDAPDRIAIDLQGAVVEGTAYFNQILELSGGINLRDAHVSVLADDETSWPDPGFLRLNGFTYDRFSDDYADAFRTPTNWQKRCHWLGLQPEDDLGKHFKPQPWTQLAKVLRGMGHSRAASQILFRRERLRLSWANQDVSKREWFWRTLFLGLPAGFGYQTHRALIGLFLVWLLGCGVYALAAKADLFRPANEEIIALDDYQQSGRVPADYEALNLPLYSFDALVPLADFHQESRWLPRGAGEREVDFAALYPGPAGWPFGSMALGGLSRLYEAGFAKAFFVLQIAAGWFLTTIAAAGFTGLLERKE